MAKLSYSKIAKQLAAKEKKYSKLLNNARNERERNTAQMMLDRVNSRKQELAMDNQMRADQINGNQFGYGGNTKKSYLNGGMTKKSVYRLGGFTQIPVINEQDLIEKGVDPTQPTEYALAQAKRNKAFSPKGSNYNNQNVLDYLVENPELAAALKELGIEPTLQNIEALQNELGVKADNKAGAITMGALEKYNQDFMAAKAQGATDEEAEAVADAQNPDAKGKIDLKTTGTNMTWEKGDFNLTPTEKAYRAAGIAGAFVDNAARYRQIRSTQQPAAPMYMSAPVLETRMNIAPQLNEARTAQASFNRGLSRSGMGGGQKMAAQAAAYAGRVNAANKMYGEKSNREIALRNRQRQIAAQTSNQNRQMYGQYRNNLINFENARLGAIAQNAANFGQDLSSISSDYTKNMTAPRLQLEAYRPYLGSYYNRNFVGGGVNKNQ